MTRALSLILLMLACGDKGDSPPPDGGADGNTPIDDTGSTDVTGDPATVPLAGDCPAASRLGGFAVSVYDDYSLVQGAVANGVVPVAVLTEVSTEGDCVLLRKENPFCDPPCDPSDTCDLDGECVPYPENQDLGTVVVAGLAVPVSMSPVTPGNTYFSSGLPHPAFGQDDLIELRLTEGYVGAATLHGVGGAPFSTTDLDWVVVDGQPLEVIWDPAAADTRTSIRLQLSIDQHGASPGLIRCTFEDGGTGTVPASLLTALVASGVSGYPSGLLSRRTADSTTFSAGCHDLVVDQPKNISVAVNGYTPCHDDGDCPDGQKCNLDLEICE